MSLERLGSTDEISNLSETFPSGLGLSVGVYHSTFHHVWRLNTILCHLGRIKGKLVPEVILSWGRLEALTAELCHHRTENNLLPIFCLNTSAPHLRIIQLYYLPNGELHLSMYVSTSNALAKNLKTPRAGSSPYYIVQLYATHYFLLHLCKINGLP